MTDPMHELEALRQGTFELPERPTPTPAVRPEPGERSVLTEDEATHLVSMTFRSRSGNAQPHVVSIGYDGIPMCICRATHPCWALKAFCRITGKATP